MSRGGDGLPALSRRRFLVVAGASLSWMALGGCGDDEASRVLPSSAAVRDAERRRRRPGARVHE
ncbi:MAG: hypothetical protein M3Q48_08905, partial [Actinomycetota bacterium]|nr:hypothetical protein [Actinomycetota bacterium]